MPLTTADIGIQLLIDSTVGEPAGDRIQQHGPGLSGGPQPGARPGGASGAGAAAGLTGGQAAAEL
jgi:hypothetical protein